MSSFVLVECPIGNQPLQLATSGLNIRIVNINY